MSMQDRHKEKIRKLLALSQSDFRKGVLNKVYRYVEMINNLTADAKSSVIWLTTQIALNKGRRTAHKRGFFMSAICSHLPVMVGRALTLSSDGGKVLFLVCADLCGYVSVLPSHLIELTTSIRWLLKNTRSTTMAHPRLKVEARLSVYAVFVKKAVQNIPHIGDSPRCIIDLKEISQLSKLSVDKVRIGLEELQREGYLCRMFKGRRTKQRVYAMTNPDLKGTAQEVWS